MDASASGTIIGVVSASYTPAGTDLGVGTVTLFGKTKSVTPISPGSLVEGGAPVQLNAEADDTNGDPVAVTPGSFHWVNDRRQQCR